MVKDKLSFKTDGMICLFLLLLDFFSLFVHFLASKNNCTLKLLIALESERGCFCCDISQDGGA